MTGKGRLLWLALLWGMAGSGWAADAAMLNKARELVAQGQAKEAYELLIPKQSDYAGEVDYDYLLGVAALDAGHPNEAVFALERVLAVNPQHAQARAEIARAYFQMGEVDASKEQFEAVKSQNPPAPVQATIEKFLSAIERVKSGERTSVKAYLEAGIGHDSNVNSATADQAVAIPAFGGAIATLSNSGIQQEDTFFSVGGGFSVRHAATPEWIVSAGAAFNQKRNSTEDQFDTGTLDANVGLTRVSGDNFYSVTAQHQNYYVDNSDYRYADGFTLQWLRNLTQSSQASAYFQYTDVVYPNQSPRDADRYVGGVAYARALGGDYSPVVYAGGYWVEEKEKNSAFPWLGHNAPGLRVGGEMRLNAKTTLFASLSGEWRRYNGQDPLFLVTREDKQYDFRIGASYVPAPSWTITPQLAYTQNDSNVPINDYDRTVVSVTLRRNFN